MINKVLYDVKFEEGKSALQRKVKRSRTFNLAVPNLNKIFFILEHIERASHYLLYKSGKSPKH